MTLLLLSGQMIIFSQQKEKFTWEMKVKSLRKCHIAIL